MSETIWVYGYHDTSMKRASAIVEARGIYFWQDAPKIAWQWAQFSYSPLLKTMYNGFISSYQQQNLTLPQQNPDRSKAHRRDCSFFNYVVKTFNSSSDYRIDRGSIGICRRRSNFSNFGNLRSYPYPDCDFGFKFN